MGRKTGSVINNITKSQLEKAAKESKTIKAALLILGITSQSYYNWFKNKVFEYNIDVSHFEGKAHKGTVIRSPLENIFIVNSKRNSSVIKNRLIFENIKELKCEDCGLDTWNGNPIMLELHHINGVNDDNRLENLQLLCRNCHGYTDTFCGKNKQSTISNKNKLRSKRDYSLNKFCLECSKSISNKATRCDFCSRTAARRFKPDKTEFLKDVDNLTKPELLLKYRVSEKTINKRIKEFLGTNSFDRVDGD